MTLRDRRFAFCNHQCRDIDLGLDGARLLEEK